METLFKLVVVFFASLSTGALIINWIGLARAMSRLSSASAYVEFHQATNKTFDPYMPIVIFGALLGGVVLAIFSSGIRSAPGQFAIAGVLGYVAVLAIGLPTCVKMNKIVAQWSIDNPPDNWTAFRARWIRFHILRTLASIPALAAYILSCLLTR
jgi:uncharacterized membrane protein